MRAVARALALAVLAAAAASCARPADAPSRVIDLGHPLAAGDPSWTGERVFTHDVVATYAKDTYFAGRFASDEHFGTHLDAPAHFASGRWTVDEIPADRLVRPGVTIDVSSKVEADPDYLLTRADVEAFERAHGAIPEGAVVFVATGWDRRWTASDGAYMNSQQGVKHFPGLSVEAATLLARERRVAGIGIDTPSIDHGPSQHFDAHRATQPENVYHIENATNLTSLPSSGFTAVVAPIKIKGGSGGPTRVFALVPAR